MTDLILDLATLRPTLNRVTVEATPHEAGLSGAEWRAPVVGAFRVEMSGSRVTVRGTVSTTAHLECVRCLSEFDLELSAPLTVFADRSGSGNREEQEQLERDDFMLFHDGRRLDLRDTVREALMLEIPISPVCREDCKGLCPKCGADRNAGPCRCAD